MQSLFEKFQGDSRHHVLRNEKKEKVELFIEHMLQEKSLRQLAKEVDISLNTSWDWKRRIEKELSNDPAPVNERLEEILAFEAELM